MELTDEEVGAALMQIILQRTGAGDDAGCDWVTEGVNSTIVGGLEVSSDPTIATLVDAYNVLMVGHVLRY